MTTRKVSQTSHKAASAPAPRVAYHAGPPDLGFNGRSWRIGVAREISADEWKAMQARADFALFDFRKE